MEIKVQVNIPMLGKFEGTVEVPEEHSDSLNEAHLWAVDRIMSEIEVDTDIVR